MLAFDCYWPFQLSVRKRPQSASARLSGGDLAGGQNLREGEDLSASQDVLGEWGDVSIPTLSSTRDNSSSGCGDRIAFRPTEAGTG
jgi:hypothetical protein